MQQTATQTRVRFAIVLAGAAIVSGCASSGDIASSGTSRESTLGDAVATAQGPQRPSHAPSQVQLGFGENRPLAPVRAESEQQSKESAAQAARIRPLREAKTFLGTVPCMDGLDCPAVRLTLTLAPNGQFRARQETTQSGANSATAEQGCWYLAGSNPWRIVLRKPGQEGSVASMSFVNDNILRVSTLNDHAPTLNYQLTRQPDIDAVGELDNQPAPDCTLN